MHQTPEGLEERVDQLKPIPSEIQVSGPAGSALVMDSRIWHSSAANPSPGPRVAIITRYCPWWLSVEFIGRNNAIVPRETFAALPEAVKPLYRHRAEGEENPFRA
jgi:ectoine hydroxylase-related dioxygenase (phytanoyl-CoA dioxygenase family)